MALQSCPKSHEFPVPAVTKYHKHSDLRQTSCFIACRPPGGSREKSNSGNPSLLAVFPFSHLLHDFYPIFLSYIGTLVITLTGST